MNIEELIEWLEEEQSALQLSAQAEVYPPLEHNLIGQYDMCTRLLELLHKDFSSEEEQ